jgi:hypothetical protein
MKKLMQWQIDDRLVVWNEAIDHMDGDVYDNTSERLQGAIIRKQMIKMRDKFYKKHS